jgi:hypothetical protein
MSMEETLIFYILSYLLTAMWNWTYRQSES